MATEAAGGSRPWWQDWRFYTLSSGLAVVAALARANPSMGLLPLLAIPVLVAPLYFGPAVTGGLATAAWCLALVVAVTTTALEPMTDVVWMVAMTFVGILAVVDAVVRERAKRGRIALEARVHDSEARYRMIAENATDVVFLISPEGLIEWSSSGIERLSGWTPDEVIGRSGLEFIHPEDLERAVAALAEAGSDHLPSATVRLQTKSGEYRWIEATVHPVREDGEIVSFVGGWRDAQEQVEARQELVASEERFRLLAENSSDVVFLTELDTVLWVSPSLSRTLGWEPEEIIGRSLQDFGNPDDADAMAVARTEMEQGRSVGLRVRLIDKWGTLHWVDVHAQPYDGLHGSPGGFQASFRTVDAEVAATQQLERRARFDDLTGVLKRQEALTRLSESGARERQRGFECGVLFIDVDDFKDLNDQRGHQAGDDYLVSLARRIEGIVRSGDLVARLGGDEFVVILEGLRDLQDAEVIAEKVRTAAAEPLQTKRGTLGATVSIGVTLSRSMESSDDIIARADHAMYRAKDHGRNRVISI